MMPIILKMSIMPEILIMSIMPEILIMSEMLKILIINFAKVSNFGKVCAVKSDTLEDSEGNGKVRKRVKRDFGEKRV